MELPYLIAIPLAIAFITQLTKFVVRIGQTGHLDWSVLNQYGGMPSGHTAFVISLLTIIGRHEGIYSSTFAVAFAFALLTIRDAVSFRRYLSRYGSVINVLLKEHPGHEDLEGHTKVENKLGHTPVQALVGALIGFVLTVVADSLWT